MVVSSELDAAIRRVRPEEFKDALIRRSSVSAVASLWGVADVTLWVSVKAEPSRNYSSAAVLPGTDPLEVVIGASMVVGRVGA